MNLILCVLAFSKTGTMGGNSKITLEMARFGARNGVSVHFIVQPHSIEGAKKELGSDSDLMHWHVTEPIPEYTHNPISATKKACAEVNKIFNAINVGQSDIVFSCNEVPFESFPIMREKKRRGFFFLASVFLFAPGPVDNLLGRYKFPFFKFILVKIHQDLILRRLRHAADAYVITNDCDKRRLAKGIPRDRLFAIYGGVNVDQIPVGEQNKTRDVVFCSRLHPQKGINGFLDTWKMVLADNPGRRLTVIGNGDADYEKFLKDKAKRLGISSSIDWLGYVNGVEKYKIYKSAKVFVHPTVYDNNGMVAAEALCTGLPVVMFDLPELRDVYSVGCIKASRGDKKGFAELVVRLLTDDKFHEDVRPDAEQIAALRDHWSWSNRMKCFFDFLKGVV